ncbi:MAG: hypothetical protein QOE90_2296 [Thermoplasmata archaeon]|jgi:hypothetical protein|nr:hypothetical protein [Thermoplasmata archaeon]
MDYTTTAELVIGSVTAIATSASAIIVARDRGRARRDQLMELLYVRMLHEARVHHVFPETWGNETGIVTCWRTFEDEKPYLLRSVPRRLRKKLVQLSAMHEESVLLGSVANDIARDAGRRAGHSIGDPNKTTVGDVNIRVMAHGPGGTRPLHTVTRLEDFWLSAVSPATWAQDFVTARVPSAQAGLEVLVDGYISSDHGAWQSVIAEVNAAISAWSDGPRLRELVRTQHRLAGEIKELLEREMGRGNT